MNTRSRVYKRTEANKTNKKQLMNLLGLSEEDYFWQKVDSGVAYLKTHYPNIGKYASIYKDISSCPNYWAWWNLQYSTHEAGFLHYSINFSAQRAKLEWYMNMFYLIEDASLDGSFNNNYLKAIRYEKEKEGISYG